MRLVLSTVSTLLLPCSSVIIMIIMTIILNITIVIILSIVRIIQIGRSQRAPARFQDGGSLPRA